MKRQATKFNRAIHGSASRRPVVSAVAVYAASGPPSFGVECDGAVPNIANAQPLTGQSHRFVIESPPNPALCSA